MPIYNGKEISDEESFAILSGNPRRAVAWNDRNRCMQIQTSWVPGDANKADRREVSMRLTGRALSSREVLVRLAQIGTASRTSAAKADRLCSELLSELA
jgi:hypothetical protein